MAGCATTEEGSGMTAEQAISDAKAANAKAKAVGYEWRDTGKIIKSAEAALEAGNEEEAIKLANKAKKQAEDAIAQEKAESEKYMNSLSDEDRAALMNAESSMSKSSGSSGSADGASSYSVVRGDNLWDISGKSSIYGNSYQWPLIYKTNRNKIKDADLIYPGQVFDIDQNASASEIDAAVNHAKTRGAWSVGDVEQSDLDYLGR
jgi:nucleoid-associated protein YgaU